MTDDSHVLATLRRGMIPTHYDQGQFLFRQGDWGETLYYVCEGALKFDRRLSDDTVTLLDLVGPGTFFATVNAFQPAPYEVSALVLAPSVIASMKRARFLDLVDRDPVIAQALLLSTATALRARHVGDLEMSALPAAVRVARVVADLARRFGRPGGTDIHVDLNLTQGELAQMLALNRRTVNQSLASMVSRGWMSIERRGFIIHDYEAIQHRARP